MKIDEYGCLVVEHVPWPGSIGDSCAESARYEHLKMLLGDYVHTCNLERFVTPLGYLRHPTAPETGAELPNGEVLKESWRESDMSTDQALPLYLAWRRGTNYTRTSQMERRIKSNGYRTGNGDYISPGFYAELKDSQILRSLFLLIQILFFKLPYRWNDEKRTLELTTGSVADYLNYIHCAVYAPKWVRRIGPSKNVLYKAVTTYYQPELALPETQPCLVCKIIDLYDQVIETYF